MGTQPLDAEHDGYQLSISSDGTHLVATGEDGVFTETSDWFRGVVLSDGRGGEVRIESSVKSGVDTKYQLVQRARPTDAWVTLCGSQNAYASLVRGDEKGVVQGGGAITFACGETENGLYILGSIPDEWHDDDHHYRVATSPIDPGHAGATINVTAAVVGTHLIAIGAPAPHIGADTWFRGMILPDLTGGQVLIDGVQSVSRTLTKYHLKRRATPVGPWVEYCGKPNLYATPVRGWYDPFRVHHDDDTLSFSCDDGAVGKCSIWGYPAGPRGPGDHAWDRHQACTLMANAKYCGNDPPRTREQTPIVIRDFDASPNPYPDLTRADPMPGNPDVFYFEAGWRVSPTFGPVCLSKLRWRSLPPDPCGSELPDPRVGPGHGQFCEDMTYEQLRAAGALIVNGSKTMDMPVHVWRNPDSGDQVATVRGYHAFGESLPPFTGYDHVGVDSMLLRNLPGTLLDTDMLKLYLWEHKTTHHRVISSSAPSTDYDDLGFEAYSFATQMFPALRLLERCDGPGGMSVTIHGCPNGQPGVAQGWAMQPP